LATAPAAPSSACTALSTASDGASFLGCAQRREPVLNRRQPGEREMTFERTIVGLLVLVIAALAAAFYIDWRMAVQLRTMKAFVEGYVFSEAVAACEKAQSSTPFKWNGGTNTAVVGLNSVKPDKYTVIASFTLVADGVYCDYDPIKKKADIGSNFLERD
jgi:hypothetical protein